MIITLALALLQISQQPTYDHVILISVDGLRSDALLTEQAKSFKNFQRLLKGANTLNARTDCDFTTTLPNHTGMLTSRLVNGPQGHGYTANTTPAVGVVLNDINGNLIQSIYDQTAAAKIHSGLIASKNKFILFQQSYPQLIDDFFINKNGGVELEHLIQDLNGNRSKRSFNFIHFLHPDVAGHLYGWNLSGDSKYMQAVAAVDSLLGDLFAWLDANPQYAAATAIVLTSDHGGGAPHKNHHGIGHLWVNYIIPFIVWTGDGKANGDLFELNPSTHSDPGLNDPRPTESKPSIRNADAGNLCLYLLGLPSIINSTRNVQQNIKVN